MDEVGRPPAIIDWDKVDELLKVGCTGTEIAANIGIHPDTLYKRVVIDKNIPSFSVYSQQKRSVGLNELRKAQHEMALKNPTMAIWLGKQFLDQREPDNHVLEQNLSALKAFLDMQDKAKTEESVDVNREPVQETTP